VIQVIASALQNVKFKVFCIPLSTFLAIPGEFERSISFPDS
jgi:hypothetical protein